MRACSAGDGVAHQQAAGLARDAVTRTRPKAFECPGCLRRSVLESRLRRMSEVIDPIAIPIGTWEAKIGSGPRIEDERLIRMRRSLICDESQAHGEMRCAWGDFTKQ